MSKLKKFFWFFLFTKRTAYLRFLEHADPLTEASNKIALILAGNTPFYPLYLYFILGKSGLPWLYYAAAALPFFAATFWLARGQGLAGRVWLCVVATGNSVYVTWLLGEASGTALFLIPCISLAVLSFRAAEFFTMVPLALLPAVLFWLLHGHFPAPPATYSLAQYKSLTTLSEVSVASITGVLAYLLGKAREYQRSAP